ncbi:hypothetical protein ACIQCG_41590 [Streptomyces noursei]|uniref:AraC-like ligand-binding domain-containing protein n=1 Tax=Streptomyces noursei TaxID=1971 RepID=UPI00380EBE30
MLKETVFRSEDVPVGDRLAYWAECVGRTHAPVRMSSEHAHDFRATQRVLDLGPVTVWPATFQQLRTQRTPKLIRRSDPEVYHVSLITEGTAVIDWAGHGTTYHPSDLHINDSSVPWELRTDDAPVTAVGIELPRALLPLPPTMTERALPRRMSPSPASAVQRASGAEGAPSGSTPAQVNAIAEHDEPAEETTLHAAIPAQRAADQAPSPSPALSVDVVRQAVREVLSEELAPVLAPLVAADRNTARPAGDQHDAPDRVREAAAEIKGELSTTLGEARSELAALQQEIADLRAVVEELRPLPAATAGTTAASVSKEHGALLKTAARVSSASLLCHRDIWEFVTGHAGRHPHFRVPPQVGDEGDQRIRAALSGRSLIALLISLHSIQHTATDGDGDRELATTVYERIEASLTGLTPSGKPVTITLDDRTTAANTPPAANDVESDDVPVNTGTPPASAEPDTDPGEEADPAPA